MSTATTMEWPSTGLELWSETQPYDKIQLLQKLGKNTFEKNKWCYTFAGYGKDIYGSWTEYIDVAQKSDSWIFAILGPGQSLQSKWLTMEISKRNDKWSLPKNMQESIQLNPSIVLNYAGHTHTIQLPEQINWNTWFELLDKTYGAISEKCAALDETKQKDPAVIKNIVIQTLQEKNYLKAQVGEEVKKTTWRVSGRLLDVLKWLFWSNTEKINADE